MPTPSPPGSLSKRASRSTLPKLPSFRGEKDAAKAVKAAADAAAKVALAEKAERERTAAAEEEARQAEAEAAKAKRKAFLEAEKHRKGEAAGATFSEEERATFHELFTEFDADKSGEIDAEELAAMIESLGMVVGKSQVALWLEAADDSKNAAIDFDEFLLVIARARDNAPSGFAQMIARRRLSGPPMRWRTDKKGPGIEVQADGKSLGRRHDGRWGAQLLDTWLSAGTYDAATVVLEFVESPGEAFVGVVGTNFAPGDWDVPLSKSIHAFAFKTESGDFFSKTRHETLAKCAPVTSGCRVAFEIDMVNRSMVVQVVQPSADGEPKILSSVSIGDLPAELCVGMACGPAEGPPFHVRVVGSSCEKTGRDRNRKTHAGLHDAENRQTLEAERVVLKMDELTKVALTLDD